MANRFTSRLKNVLKERGGAAARLHETNEEQAAREARIDEEMRIYQAEVDRIFAEKDAKDPCWRCRHVSKGFQPYCMVDRAIVPAGGCKRGQRCGHAG